VTRVRPAIAGIPSSLELRRDKTWRERRGKHHHLWQSDDVVDMFDSARGKLSIHDSILPRTSFAVHPVIYASRRAIVV
jgi:hypothetical protein